MPESLPLRRTTIIQVSRPPSSLWRFHWHELFPIRASDGDDAYLPAIEPGRRREAVRRLLRRSLRAVDLETPRPVVVAGFLVQVLEERVALLPGVRAKLEAILDRRSA